MLCPSGFSSIQFIQTFLARRCATTKFTDDADLHDWSREAVYFMNSKDIIKGVSTTENKFGAKGTATREQALLISVRSADKFAK